MRTRKRLSRSESQTKRHILVAWQSHKRTNNCFDEISWDLEKVSFPCNAKSLFYPSFRRVISEVSRGLSNFEIA